MAITGNYDTARLNRKAVTILMGDVFGRTVEQSPGASLSPHFHTTDQFPVMRRRRSGPSP